MNRARRLSRSAVTLLLGLLALGMAAPIVLTLANSLMSEREIAENYELLGGMADAAGKGAGAFITLKLIPDWVTFEQYAKVLIETPLFLRLFWNSAGMVVPIVAGQTIVASLAAYAFAKLRFRGRDRLFLVYLMTMLMPFQVTLVPNYLMLDTLGLLNKAEAVILPAVFGTFGVFMLRQFLAHIPYAYMEAARIDGAGHATIFLRIVLPLAKPGLAALAVLLFVDYWNMVEQPLVFLREASEQPLSLYLAYINEQARGVGFAASIVYMTPMVLLFLYAEAYFVEGIQHSGLKG